MDRLKSVLFAITLRRGAQSLFSIIVYSNTSEATANKRKTQRLSLSLAKGLIISEHFQAVTAKEVTKSKSPMLLTTHGTQVTGQTDLEWSCRNPSSAQMS